MPAPVTALIATEPGWSSTMAFASSGAMSALLTTSSSGTSAASISLSTARTASIWPCGSDALASTTCRR